MNNAEISIEYVETLNKSLSIDIEQAFSNMQSKEKGKIESCLAGMKSVTFTLRTVVDYGMEQLRVSAVKPRVTPWVDAFLTVNHQIDEVILFFNLLFYSSDLTRNKKSITSFVMFSFQDELLRYETDEPFIQTLAMNLDGLLQVFKNSLTESNYNTLTGILTAEVTTRFEKVILKSTFNQVNNRKKFK